MYTRCPECQTVFRLDAAQLRVGRGRVRCGKCLQVFDALPFLTDVVPAASDVGDSSESPKAAGNLAVKPPLHPSRAGGRQVDGSGSSEMEADDGPAQTESADSEPVPEVLREDMVRIAQARGAVRRRVVLSLASAMLVVLVAAQYAWFHPNDVVRWYPNSREWVEAFCRHAGCEAPERSDPSLVQMHSRDVRVHPEYEGALRVMATLANTAPHVQPYPRMRLSLFNVNGQVIASRTFLPEEYLDASVDVSQGMPSGTPTQVAFDVLAAEEAAVSFEFRFL